MKKITKKLCSTVCALLAFSGNRGGALTKEILCNAGQWFACLLNGMENFGIFYKRENDKFVPKKLTPGQKAYAYAMRAATIVNAVDAVQRSYNIGYDIIKGSKNKPNTISKKESKNYWPILEAIFGVSQFDFAFRHAYAADTKCKMFCEVGIIHLILSSISLTDAYFRFQGDNQNSKSPISKKKETAQQNLTPSNPKNSESDKK